MSFNVRTVISREGERIHVIGDSEIECSGKGCHLCGLYKEQNFIEWENRIPFPVPKKGKRYKDKEKQAVRGKTVLEICHTCPLAPNGIPCYLCRRTKCEKWMKEQHRKGQQAGCSSWWNDRCEEFSCERGLIVKDW